MRAASLLLLSCATIVCATPVRLLSGETVQSDAQRPPVRAVLCVSLQRQDETVNAHLITGDNRECPPHTAKAAIGRYADTVHEIGWGRLDIETSKHMFSDHVRAYAAGYVEGVLTAHRISQQISNYRTNVFKSQDGTPPPKTRQFLADQLQWTREHSYLAWRRLESERLGSSQSDALYMTQDEKYWRTVHVVVFDGLVDGYTKASGIPRSDAEEALSWINSNNEIDELMKTVFNETAAPSFEEMSVDELNMLSCSAFIRVLPGNKDVLLAHNTWRGYFGMLRLFKYYHFHLSFTSTSFGFSSAAGTTSSHDDFYMTSKGLAIAETTNSQFNVSYIQNHTKPQSLVVWQRATIASILASSGREWANIFGRENSGLYSNQWMIVDYNLFTPGMTNLPDNLLTISEQLPDRCVTGDGTPRLRKEGLWPSYNIPYFPEVYNISGYPDMIAKKGDTLSYEKCPRAKIFAREKDSVNDLRDAMRLIRLNEWPNDPLSQNGPGDAISSRYDLDSNPRAFGGVDGKITGHEMMSTLSAVAQSGPTWQGQVPFAWDMANLSEPVTRHGLPELYRFPWIRFDAWED